jgi:hypothetical protein
MDVEDTDDKVRRNFVAISTVVLMSAWLQLKIDDLLERVLGTKAGDPIDSQKAWAAVVVLLLYTMLRFRAADSTQKQKHDLVRKILEYRTQLGSALFYRDLARFEATGRAKYLETQALSAVKLDKYPNLPPNLRRYSANGNSGGYERVHDIDIYVASSPQTSTSVRVKLSIPRITWAAYGFVATVQGVLLSKPGLDFAYPWAIGTLAFGYAIKNLFGF